MISRALTFLVGLFVAGSAVDKANAESPFYPLGLAFAPMVPSQIYPEDGNLIIMLDYEPSGEDWTELRKIYCESVDLMRRLELTAFIVDTQSGRSEPVTLEDACSGVVS